MPAGIPWRSKASSRCWWRFHGLLDTALNSDGLNNTWDWIDADLTIVTAPKANHFVQHDAAELVSSTLSWWLKARQ